MQKRDIRLLVLIAIITALAIWVVLPTNPGIHIRLGETTLDRDIKLLLGLDLQGGMQLLLQPDIPAGQTVSAEDMQAVKKIVENRVNGMGVTEPVVQLVGADRILVEMPGIKNSEEAVASLRQTGSMEWVDVGNQYFPAGTAISTTYQLYGTLDTITSTTPLTDVYKTILTGKYLKTAQVEFSNTGAPMIAFQLNSEGAQIFVDHTTNNIDKYIAIVLDGVVISCPRINSAIPDGSGVIEGQFTADEATALVLQLRYGALPVALKVVDTREIGPSLGQDSITKSVKAGIIGLVVVLLFMMIHYRLPGFLTDLSLIIYALITVALYKLIPVTLTLPGIAGFLLSIGMAVDANVLIFERMREELRAGKTLQRAINSGFKRAWSAILDSNISVWITCFILYMFGNSFGASTVKGFAITLALGVLVSMFTAVTVTRTFVSVAFAIGGEKIREHKWLLGI
ncbi:MAG: protein translocase subunit SecD [Chloroflexi bacterium]|nr:protein translocase subunit SecD [Chloroflexota bacterium]